MHFGIDVRAACRKKRAGKGQWTYGFVTELLKSTHVFTLYTDDDIPASWNDVIAARPEKIHIVRFPGGLKWHFATASHLKQSLEIDAYVSTVSYIVPWLLLTTKPCIPIVHDLIAFRREPHDRKATLIERLTLRGAVKHAAMICTISETTKSDLLKRYPFLSGKKIVTLYAAPLLVGHSERTSGHSSGVLCISTLCPRKNQLRLIEAHSMLPGHLRKKYPLILVGSRGWDDEPIVRAAVSTPHVEWKRYLSDAECAECMGDAAVFAFPSLYEGFGIPVLEAMHAGVPVLTSDRGSMKEIAGDAALLIDPGSPTAIRDGLERLLTDTRLAEALIEKGRKRAGEFSWKRTVDLFLAGAEGIDKRR